MRIKAASNTFADDPSSANTFVVATSLSTTSMYCPAPDKWVTLAHAACKVRYLGDGNGVPVSDFNVIVSGRPLSIKSEVAANLYLLGVS